MTAPAGWRRDPWFPSQLRYWDGSAWTSHTAPFAHDASRSRLLGRWRRQPSAKFKPSGPLVDSTYAMLMANKAMIALMFVGSVVAAAAAGAVLLPAITWWHVSPGFSSGGVAGAAVSGAVLALFTFVTQLTTGAVVAAAVLRADGEAPTVRRVLAIAWSRRWQILAWSLVAAVVGAVIRGLERCGVGGLVAALTLNLGWAVATVFAMPVVIVEGTLPIETVRRSSRVLRDNFGATLFGNLRLAVPWTIATWVSLGLAAGGAVAVVEGDTTAVVIGAVAAVVGTAGAAFCLMTSAALSAYLQTNLYRYANRQPVPGIDPRWLPPLAPS